MARIGTLEDVVSAIAAAPAGARVQVPSGLAHSRALTAALQARPDVASDRVFAGLFIPGVDGFDYASLHASSQMATPLMAGHLRSGFEAGRVHPFPGSYRQMYDTLGRRAPGDIAIAVVAPMGKGRFSFGVAADAGPAVAKPGAGLSVALLNEALPTSRSEAAMSWTDADALDLVVPIEEPIAWLEPEAAPTGTLARVAAHAAALVRDGDCLQFGIGKLPGAILRHLTDRRHLSVHSGLYHDALIELMDAGAMNENDLTAGVALGGQALAQRLLAAGARFAPVDHTHDPTVIAQRRRFTALNSALEVDLFGQVNSCFIGDRLVAGFGGLPDFAQGALRSEGGRLIIALPATAGDQSRIVPRLNCPWVTLPQGFAHAVVTEHGVADLAGKSLDARAQALIGVAAPEHRDALGRAWTQLWRSL